ncbi:MAG: helix-turn-helix transcriptional regulator [Pseudomonadales bacterium]
MGLNVDLNAYNDLLGLVYDGVQEQTPWKSFIHQLGHRIESKDVSLLISCPRATGGDYLLVTTDDDPRLTSEHVRKLMSVNLLMEIPQPHAGTVDDVIPRELFLSSALYQDFLQPMSISYLLGQDLYRNNGLHIKLGLQRTTDQQQFTKHDKELLDLIAPHFRKAIKLREQSQQGSYFQTFFGETMSKMGVSCFLVDGRGQIMSMNETAEGTIKAKNGLCIRNGKLCSTDEVGGQELRKAIELALAAHHNHCNCQQGVGFRIGGNSGAPILDIVVRPIVSDLLQDSLTTPAAMVYASDCSKRSIEIDPEVLANMYGFTHRESRLGVLLAQGASLSEAADQLDVSINTVKTHLRGIYEKMGSNKQAQVVARLNASTAKLL